MNDYVVSPRALNDLAAIDDYISADNPAAAERLLESFRETFALLASVPEAGRRRDEVIAGIRSFPVGSYVIFYRIIRGRVEIVRVLHGSRDIRRAFDA